jgi:hypothetical protein
LGEDDNDDDQKELHSTHRRRPKLTLEFQQESLSRKQVLQRLIFCCIMLNVTFVLWGALQVRYIFFL